ncbi:MAG TPA: nuclear transport factor 2 family protein [Acidimicrobiales bacterium]|nr:nuclear transport factor 2 family protein [Acidimicrobiales bacterium]
MISQEQAAAFGREWIDAWNRHDLDAIVGHYDDAVVFRSPFVATLAAEPSGTLRGQARLRAYFAEALRKYPDLRFTDLRALAGVSSVTLTYRSVNNLHAAEVMTLNEAGRVVGVDAHYAAP